MTDRLGILYPVEIFTTVGHAFIVDDSIAPIFRLHFRCRTPLHTPAQRKPNQASPALILPSFRLTSIVFGRLSTPQVFLSTAYRSGWLRRESRHGNLLLLLRRTCYVL